MKPSIAYSQNKCSIWIYGILFLTATVTALLAVKNIGLSPDSMIYALISEEILSGNGISLPILFSLKDNYDFIDGTISYVGGPPLLPILFALLGGVTPKSFLPAQIINVMSHVVISTFAFLLMKKLYDNKGIALLTGILVSTSYPLLWDAHHMLTEPSFIALALAMLYFLILSRKTDSHQSVKFYFIASICASAAILTRFAGIALLPVFFWGTFVLVKNNSIKFKKAPSILIAAIPFITTGALFIITFMISGSTHGLDTPAPERSYLSAIMVTLKMMVLQFGLGERHITLITICLLLFILCVMVSTYARRKLSSYMQSGLDLIFLFVISHTVIISHAMAKSQTVIEFRYMHPIVPLLFILCILSVVVLWEMISSRGFSKLSFYGLILSLGIIALGSGYKTYSNYREVFSWKAGHYRILNSPTYNWIKENYGENVIITSNRPFHLSFFGGYSTIRLPHRRFNTGYRIPDNMESYLPNRMSKYGSRVLALFENADEEHEGRYVAGLFNKRDDDDGFVLMHSSSDGVVYSLKE